MKILIYELGSDLLTTKSWRSLHGCPSYTKKTYFAIHRWIPEWLRNLSLDARVWGSEDTGSHWLWSVLNLHIGTVLLVSFWRRYLQRLGGQRHATTIGWQHTLLAPLIWSYTGADYFLCIVSLVCLLPHSSSTYNSRLGM